MTENRKEEQGLSLMDIGPLFELIPVAEGKSIKVFGVSAKGIFSIFGRFPEVARWFQGGGKPDVAMLAKQAPDALGAVIAAGCGFPGDPEAETRADALSVETQIDIVEAIGRLTFKNGFGPFVQRIVALSNAAALQNYGRAAVTTSPPASKPASPPATEPSSSGT